MERTRAFGSAVPAMRPGFALMLVHRQAPIVGGRALESSETYEMASEADLKPMQVLEGTIGSHSAPNFIAYSPGS